MKIMATSFKRSCACTATPSALALQQATTDSHLHQRLLDTHRQVWVSLLWGPFSWLLLCTRISLCLPRVCSPALCKFWQLYGGFNGDFLQEGLCHTQVCCTRTPAPASGHCWPVPLQETLKHSKAGLSQCLWGLQVCTSFCLSPLSNSDRYGL